uniref:insulin-induced gene 2 protein isoform X5 n=1 Tax=Halichoerus grypus TaxID=9711 RepID=UPI00165A0D52|nr:insulin-induced gene 2 protein isoform X5 [Halichoerus grypus]
MAEGETESPRPKKRGPYISSVTSRSVNLMIRGVVLFFIGVFLALVLNLLQIQRNVTLFPPDVIASIFSSAWWVPPCCGTASAVIGLLYPCIDRHLGEPHKFKREWSSVMRYTSPDFLYVRSWLPCIFFAGGITMGNIGRQLAMDFFTESKFDLRRTVMECSQDPHFLSYGITKRCLMHKRQKDQEARCSR